MKQISKIKKTTHLGRPRTKTLRFWRNLKLRESEQIHRDSSPQEDTISQLFDEIFKGIPIGFYHSTPDGRFLDVNSAMVQILGFPDRDSLLRLPVLDLYVDAEERLVQQRILANSGIVPYSEIRLRCYDGKIICARDTLRIIHNSEGLVEYEGMLEDITEKKIAEEALQRSEANLWAVLNSNLISYILIDTNLLIQAFNHTAEETSRIYFSFELRKGESFLDKVPEEYRSDFLSNFHKALSGVPTILKSNINLAEGGEEWFEYQWNPAITLEGNVIGICFTAISITSSQLAKQRNQQLYESERQHRQIAEALQEAGQALGSSLNVDSVLDIILDQASKVVAFDSGRVLLIKNSQLVISRVKGYGQYDTPELRSTTSRVFDIDETPNLKWILEHGQPLIIPDTREYSGWVTISGHQHIRSWIGIPIMAHGELIALFSLAKAEPNFFTADHTRFLSALAGQTALALENAKLFQTAQHRIQEAETLRQASAAVTTELDLDHVLDRILINLNKVIQYDSAAILLLESDQLLVVASMGFGPDVKLNGQIFPSDNPLFRQSLTTGRPIIISDALTDTTFHQILDENPTRGWLGVPLHLRGRAIGFLTINSYQANTYTEAEASLAQAFANEATIALENARLFRELQSLATIDPLTKVFNRRHFIHLAKLEFQRARRFHQPLSLILFDIDSFKTVNDSYGHAVGDQVLQCMAAICQGNLRQVDLFGRYGGEEFIALLPNTALSGAQLVAERLRQEIAQTPMPTDRGMISISASFGVAEMDDTCPDIDTLLLHADWAAYAAKSEGKNRVSTPIDNQSTDYYEFSDNK